MLMWRHTTLPTRHNVLCQDRANASVTIPTWRSNMLPLSVRDQSHAGYTDLRLPALKDSISRSSPSASCLPRVALASLSKQHILFLWSISCGPSDAPLIAAESVRI